MKRALALFALLWLAATGVHAAQPYIDYPYKQGDTYNVAGRRVYSQARPMPYSIQVRDHQLYRMELHSGEWSWVDDSPASQHNRERAELSFASGPEAVPFGKMATFETDVMLEVNSNSPNQLFITDTSYLLLAQEHADDALGGSPIFSIDIRPNASTGATAEMVQIDAMYNMVSPHNTLNNVVRNWPGPTFTRGMIHHLKASVVDCHGITSGNDAGGVPIGTGSIHVEWDGVVILDKQNIVTGYAAATYGSYFKFGQYRSHPTQPSDQTSVAWFWAPDLTIQP